MSARARFDECLAAASTWFRNKVTVATQQELQQISFHVRLAIVVFFSGVGDGGGGTDYGKRFKRLEVCR